MALKKALLRFSFFEQKFYMKNSTKKSWFDDQLKYWIELVNLLSSRFFVNCSHVVYHCYFIHKPSTKACWGTIFLFEIFLSQKIQLFLDTSNRGKDLWGGVWNLGRSSLGDVCNQTKCQAFLVGWRLKTLVKKNSSSLVGSSAIKNSSTGVTSLSWILVLGCAHAPSLFKKIKLFSGFYVLIKADARQNYVLKHISSLTIC